MKTHSSLLAASMAISLVSLAQASDWYVDPGDSLQSVINQTVDGDRIFCSPGTYAGSIRYQGKDIQIIGSGGSAVTFLDPQGSVIPTLTVDGGTPLTSSLQGFTVLPSTSTFAGCAWIYNSSLTITDCYFTGSTIGTTLSAEGSSLNMTDCEFTGSTGGSAISAVASSLNMTDCEFEDNSPQTSGGAMNLASSSLSAVDCAFTNNQTGGAVYSYQSTLSLTDCLFDGNTTWYGGAIRCEGPSESNAAVYLVRVTFRNNYSFSSAGALRVLNTLLDCSDSLFEYNSAGGNGGGMELHDLSTQGSVTRTIFRNNQAGQDGGAIRSYNAGTIFSDCVFRNNSARTGTAFHTQSSAKPRAMNCIMTENVGEYAWFSDGWTYLTNVTFVNNVNPYNDSVGRYLNMKNCIIWGPQTNMSSTNSINWSDIQGGWGGTGNIDANPMFVDRWGGDYSLLPGSPCIDAGDPNSPPDADGTRADMGATGYVLIMENGDCNGNGISDGIDSLGNDCNANGLPDECDVASGLLDCNGNGLNDCDDITNGISQDCNMNSIPDECDIFNGVSQDCNMNGIPDECDVLNGTSADVNGNGIPDECEEVGIQSCSSNPNSTGLIGSMHLFGSAALVDNDLTLFSHQLPTGILGYYLVASTSAFLPGFGGSSGVLCLGNPMVRLHRSPYGAVLSSGTTGSMSLTLDYSTLPLKAQFQPGETWYFQLWHRDMENGVPTSNTSDASQVTFF